MRNILLFILFLLAVFYVRRALRKDPRRDERDVPAEERSQARAPSEQIEQMVACAHCGVHVPESEGVRSDGHFFCSEDHRRLGARR
ncbi:PP0621 family protein [Zoogloea sp. LCSB751]|uniref:PP0621 family protein n=1 Tax=Zoogloea sp. LCSB751 TaxID=1965277 RepID=UPI0009A51D12|nr:PP0621 family protein [Zoogloea sp. LCSB751]